MSTKMDHKSFRACPIHYMSVVIFSSLTQNLYESFITNDYCLQPTPFIINTILIHNNRGLYVREMIWNPSVSSSNKAIFQFLGCKAAFLPFYFS